MPSAIVNFNVSFAKTTGWEEVSIIIDLERSPVVHAHRVIPCELNQRSHSDQIGFGYKNLYWYFNIYDEHVQSILSKF